MQTIHVTHTTISEENKLNILQVHFLEERNRIHPAIYKYANSYK